MKAGKDFDKNRNNINYIFSQVTKKNYLILRILSENKFEMSKKNLTFLRMENSF